MNSKTLMRIGAATASAGAAVMLLAAIDVSLARAAEGDEITVTAPATKVIGRAPGANNPITQVTVTARVQYDPVTLTTNSGVALLKDGVLDAARRICRAADPGAPQDNECVRQATSSAQPQIDAAVAKARAHG